MKTGGTLYRTATVTVRQFHLNENVWAVTWKAGDEWKEIKDRLKELLWAFDYKYDANSKSWLISKDYTHYVQNALMAMFRIENINWPGNDFIRQLQAQQQAEQNREQRRQERWERDQEYERTQREQRERQRREQEERARREREHEQRRRSYSAPNNAQSDPYSVLMVTRSAPLGLCEAAYRYWAKELHPDKGGSHEQMKAFNNAIAEIRRVKGK